MAFGKIRLAGLLLPLLLLLPGGVAAEGGDPAGAEVARLPVVEVVAAPAMEETSAPEDHATGKSVLDAKTTTALPLRDATINDLLTILPGIQDGEASQSSLTGGEIIPPDLSISGGKTYQNNFRIDGLGNNNLSDPLADDRTSAILVPAHTQELFLDLDLLEQVTVYDSNIPAEFGGFTGGVVDVETKRPGPETTGVLSYRTTRSNWTQQFVPDADRQKFEDSNSWSREPRFDKHEVGGTLNLPLGPRFGLIASFQQAYSRIPLQNLTAPQDQYRRNQNYFLKIGGTPEPGGYIGATLLWAPYEEKLFRPDTQNGDFTLSGGGLHLAGEWERNLFGGRWHLNGGYRQSRSKRQAPPELLGWNAESATKDWGQLVGSRFSFEGGVGSLEVVQKTLELHTSFKARQLTSGPLRHRVKVGVDGERITARYRRPQTNYTFFAITSLTPEVVCAPGATDCVDGEQYFSRRQVYAATQLTADMTLLDLYGEDRINWGRVELRPGLRLSYDDFMENLNLAPRLATAWDLFGDGGTVLIGGLNRYYGSTLLTYKLREAFSPYPPYENRSLDPDTHRPGPWLPERPGTTGYRFSDLATPYSDEWTAGLGQELFGGHLEVRYVNRRGHDEFARERGEADAAGVRNYVLNNNGSSCYHSVRLSWTRSWVRHYLLLDGTWQELRTDTVDYNTDLDLSALEKLVYYNGDLLHLSDLPATDFNRPWVANLTYVGRLPYGFTFSNVTRYLAPYRALGDTRQNTPDGFDIYGEVKHPSALTFDWKLSWQTPVFHPKRLLTLNLEVLNVFNRRIRVGTGSAEYHLGRQFWAGAEYAF